MREILFRGKRLDNGEWVEGYFCNESCASLTGPTFEEANIIRKGSVFWHPVNPKTVGQYTGLKDKNGKRIFEGDIVVFGQNIYSIIFECGSLALYDKCGEIISKIGGCIDHCYPLMTLHFQCMWEDDYAYDIEVIGNIHDNPEFMGGGK